MVIREILDVLDKEIQGHETARRRLVEVRERLLSCCKEKRAEGASRGTIKLCRGEEDGTAGRARRAA